MRALALALQLVTGQQRVELVDVQAAHVVQPDGGTVDVGEGGWLSTSALVADAKLHGEMQAENAALRKSATDEPLAWVVACVLAGFAVGAAAGYLLPHPAR